MLRISDFEFDCKALLRVSVVSIGRYVEDEGLDQIDISKVGSVDGAVGYGVNLVMTGERN